MYVASYMWLWHRQAERYLKEQHPKFMQQLRVGCRKAMFMHKFVVHVSPVWDCLTWVFSTCFSNQCFILCLFTVRWCLNCYVCSTAQSRMFEISSNLQFVWALYRLGCLVLSTCFGNQCFILCLFIARWYLNCNVCSTAQSRMFEIRQQLHTNL